MKGKLKTTIGKVRQPMLLICMTVFLCSMLKLTAFAAERPSDIADNTKYHEMLTDGIFTSNNNWDGVNGSDQCFNTVEVGTYSTYCQTAATQPAYYQTASDNVLELNGTNNNYPATIYQKVRVLPGTTVHISYQYTKRTQKINTQIDNQTMLLSVVPAASFNGTAVVAKENLTRTVFADNKLTEVTVLNGDASVTEGVIAAGSQWSEIYAVYTVPADVYEVYVAFHGVEPNDTAAGNILAYASARTATIDTVYVSSGGSDASGNGSAGSPFRSLELASYWVSESGTIVLLDDVNEDMTANKPFTLDLNGHTLNGNLTVQSSGNLTITDSSTGGTGKITGNVNGETGSKVYINSGRIDGTLTLAGTAGITGGTFAPKPDAAYIALGYECVANSDGSFTVKSISDIRSSANDEIDKAFSDTKNAIDSMTGLTDAEKEGFIKEAENAFNSAKSSIESAADADGIESAKSAGADALNDVMDHAVSADFIEAHLNDNADGTVYDDVNSANIDKILSGQESWNNLTDKQQEIINQTITALNEAKTDVKYRTYQDYLDAAAAEIEDSKTSFIKEYVSDKDGNIYKQATADNYEQLLSGKETYDKLSQAEKDAINEALAAAGGKPYDELLAAAKNVQAAVNSPKTGDSSYIMLWFILMLASGVGCITISALRRKGSAK